MHFAGGIFISQFNIMVKVSKNATFSHLRRMKESFLAGTVYLFGGDEGIGHKSFSTEKARDPASRRRGPAFDSFIPLAMMIQKDRAFSSAFLFIAGDEGIEPSPKVLETFVLPLN